MTVKTKNNIFIGVIALLSVCLALSVFGFCAKSNDLKAARSEIKEKADIVAEKEKENSSLQETLKKSEEDRAAVQSELDTTKKAKEGLENENAQLKKTITELKAKKNSQNSTPIVQNPMPSGKVCYLTFDDGPTANTLNILKTLEKYNVKATFFVVDNAYTKIEYVKQIYDAGHTVGVHTASHNYAQIYSSVDNYFADFNAVCDKIRHYTGVDTKVMRFPGGGSNTISRKYNRGIMTVLTHKVTEMGYTYFDWNVDSGDASGTLSASKIANNVLQGAKNKNSICVLMHDAAAKSTTAEALPAIIEGLAEQGFSFAALTKDSHGFHHQVNN